MERSLWTSIKLTRSTEPPNLAEGQELLISTGNITKNAIHDVLKSLRNGKAAGLENIPAEAINAGGDISVNVLHGFLNEIWKVEELPGDWTTGLLIEM